MSRDHQHVEWNDPEPDSPQWVVERGAAMYVVLHGDMHIRNGHPVYRFEPFPLQPRPVDIRRAQQQPSRLLAAESRVVPFTGRDEELARLATWRDDPTPGTSVLLIHGPGGQGKTRVAAQFATDSDRLGWTVWAGHHVSDPTAQLAVVPGETGSALVVVVDYAERWPADDLQLLLQNPVLRRPQRSRVLLVSRPAESWWPALRHRLNKADVAVGGTIALPSLAPTADGRRAIFDIARDQFAAVFGVLAKGIEPAGDLVGSGFELAITLHMAALVAVHARGGASPSDPVSLSAYLLDREHDYWQSLYDHDENVTTPPKTMARTVYTATLTRPQLRPQAAKALHRIGITADNPTHTIGDHAYCYPPTAPDLVLEPLYPDRLGEDFLALQTPGHTSADYQADEWATAAPARLLTATDLSQHDASPPVWTRAALTVLINTANRWSHVANDQLCPLLTAYPRLALMAGGAALVQLTKIENLDLTVLEAIEPHLPRRSVDIAPATAAITKILTMHRLGSTEEPTERVRLYTKLADAMLAAGLPEEALPHLMKAVTIRRQLTRADRKYVLDLATSLNDLSAALSKLGQHEEALAAAKEGIDLIRVAPQPVTDLHAFAYTSLLHNVGINLSELGRYEQALAVTQESVRLQRQLTDDTENNNLLSELANALTGLGNRLWRLGKHAQALAPAQESVIIYRDLASANSDIYEPGLATSLNNLALRYHQLQRHNEGLASAQEALTIRRQLVRANSAAYLPALATSLDNLAVIWAELGRHEESLELTAEAVELFRKLSKSNRAAHLGDLAVALNNLAVRLANLERHEQALDCVHQAIDLYADLVRANPSAHLHGRGNALNNLSNILACLGQHEQAQARAHEAIDTYRRLAETNPEAHLPDLAKSLNNLGARLSATGHHKQAVDRIRQAIDTVRRLPTETHETHLPLLAELLSHLGSELYQNRYFNQAMLAAEERVDIYRHLAKDDTTTYLPYLAIALVDLGNTLGALKQYARSLESIQEGLELLTRARRADPKGELPSSWRPPK